MKINLIKISLIAAMFFSLSAFIISNDNNKNTTHQNINIENTIPVSIRYEDNIAYVSFVLSAQWYTMDLSVDKREREIALITNSIKSETPLKINLKEGSNEILTIEEASDEVIEYYKTIYIEPKPENLDKAAASLVSIIPNQTALTALFNKIKSNSCGTTTAPSICITFRYAVDGC